jgi:membrane protease YdiL (CAAX protease family)
VATEVQYYPNGLPHPPMEVRRRIAIELLVLAILTTLYIAYFHGPRSKFMDGGLALAGLGLVGFTSRYTKEKIWGPPADAEFERLRRCFVNITLATVPVLIILAIVGGVEGYRESNNWSGVAVRFLNWRFVVSLLLYIPWALMQQTLFQFYLLGRLRALLPFASPLLLSVLNGIAYGAVHLDDPELALLTMIGGVIWSYTYHRDRYVLPIALSHAVLGTTFFYWYRGSDLLLNLYHQFS